MGNKKQHPLHQDIPETVAVWADQQQLRQVLRNLLSKHLNTLHYRTPVTVRAALSTIDGRKRKCCLCLRQYPGRWSWNRARGNSSTFFQRFVRLKRDIEGPVRGTGLACILVNNLLESMGGRIWVESTGIPGQGSCFRLVLHRVTYAAHTQRERCEVNNVMGSLHIPTVSGRKYK